MATKVKKPPAIPGFESKASDHSRFENYDIQVLHRIDLKGAPYNPRKISDEAKKKLRDNIQKRGLMEPLVWNKRTGNVVSGHQRLDVLDALHGGRDYSLRVAVVDLDEQTEKEQNIFFNNLEAQGDWDLPKLEEIFKTDIHIDATGFDMADVFDMFGDSPFIENPQTLETLSENLREAHKTLVTITKRMDERENPDFYLVVVFPSYKERKEWTDKLGLEDTRYTSREKLEQAFTRPET